MGKITERQGKGCRYYSKRFMDLFFPCCCAGCDQPLVTGESLICSICQYHLPETGFHKDPVNEAVRLLGGQVPLESVISYLYFEDQSPVQRMIHHFKYLGMSAVGRRLGEQYGKILMDYKHMITGADLIIPVPMQALKLRKRGYNQSLVFAEGLAVHLGLPVLAEGLVKDSDVKSQVGKGRLERFENLSGAVRANEASIGKLSGRHVVLVDDVLTTGATIVTCTEALLEAGADKVSVVTLARKRN